MAGYLSVTDDLTLTEMGATVVGKEFLRRSEYTPDAPPIPPQSPTAVKISGFAYGDSWTGPKTGYATASYPTLLSNLMGLYTMTNRGVAGSRIQNVAVDAQAPTSGRTWVPGYKGLVMVGALLNNQVEGDDANNRDTAYESMRALVARLSSATIREDSDAATFTYNGTFSTLTDPMPSGGTARYVNPTLAADAVHTETVTVNVPAGINYIQFIGLAPEMGVGATFTLHNGSGTEVARQRTDSRGRTTLTQGIGEGKRAPVVMRVPGTAGGIFTLKVTTPPGYSGAVLGYVDCLITLADVPPMVVLIQPVHVVHPSYQKTALETYLRTIPDTMAAEFPNVVVADPNLGFDPAMLGVDLLHPIDSGQLHVATAIRDAINATILRRSFMLDTPGVISPVPALPTTLTRKDYVDAQIVAAVNAAQLRFAPAGALATTWDRRSSSSTASLVSGALRLTAVWLPKGTTVTSATYICGTAAVSLTNRWFSLFDASRNLLRTSADNSTSWLANTPLTLPFATTYVIPSDGLYYVGICEVATTPTGIRGIATSSATAGLSPITVGDSNTGLTNAASTPTTASAIIAGGNTPYAYVS